MNKRKSRDTTAEKPPAKKKPSNDSGSGWISTRKSRFSMPKVTLSSKATSRKASISSSTKKLPSVASPRRSTLRVDNSTSAVVKDSKPASITPLKDKDKKKSGWSSVSSTSLSYSLLERDNDPGYLSPLLLTQKEPICSTVRKPSPVPPSVRKPSPAHSSVRKPSPAPSVARKPSPAPSVARKPSPAPSVARMPSPVPPSSPARKPSPVPPEAAHKRSDSSLSNISSLDFVKRVRAKQKAQKLNSNEIEEVSEKSPNRSKRTPHKNHHQSVNRHQVGDTVTARIGEKRKKEGGKNSVREPVFGKIIKSQGNNMYVVDFVNGDIRTLKSTQLVKSKSGITYENIINVDDNGADSGSNSDRPDADVIPNEEAVNEDNDYSDTEDLDLCQNSHRVKLKKALEEIKSHVGEEVRVKNSKKEEIKWIVVTDHVVFQLPHIRLTSRLGIKDISLQRGLKDTHIPLAILYMLLAYVDGEWERPLAQMNKKIEVHNNFYNRKNSKFREVRQFSEKEFVIAHAIIIGAADCSDRGEALWSTEIRAKNRNTDPREIDYEKYWTSISPKADFSIYMRLYRFKQFRQFFPTIWESDHHAGKDPWWKFQSAVDNFNEIRNELVLPSEILCVDESMSAFRPQTTKTGDMPNISYVTRKPENLGTEFKTCACPVTGILSFLEIQRGKGQMNNHKHFREIGATASCALRLAEGGSHKKPSDKVVEIVLGDSWFGSVKAAVAHAQGGFDCIFQIKQNHSLYPKQYITDILKNMPGGTKVVLTGTHQSSGTKLVATGYKYNKKPFSTSYLPKMQQLQQTELHMK